jgi:hypothetical protein
VSEALQAGGSYFKGFDIKGGKDMITRVGDDFAAGENKGGPGDIYDKFKIEGEGYTHIGRRYGDTNIPSRERGSYNKESR